MGGIIDHFQIIFLAIFSIAFTSQGLPYTCVANIADVLSVIAASTLAGSIFNDFASMSTKTGLHPSQTILPVVATKEKGVVTISPFNPAP